MHIHIYIYGRSSSRSLEANDEGDEIDKQAIVRLSHKYIFDASRRQQFHCKVAHNRGFSDCVGLIYLAIYPPSIKTAIGGGPSTFAVERTRLRGVRARIKHPFNTPPTCIAQTIAIL